MGDRIGVLNGGRIVQVGTPHEIYNSPRDTFVAGFVGSPAMNLFPAETADGKAIVVPGDDGARSRGQAGGHSWPGRPGRVTLGIRAEDIRVGPHEPFAAIVHDVENHGVEKIVTLRAGPHQLRATVPAIDPIAINDAARFGLNHGPSSRLRSGDREPPGLDQLPPPERAGAVMAKPPKRRRCYEITPRRGAAPARCGRSGCPAPSGIRA